MLVGRRLYYDRKCAKRDGLLVHRPDIGWKDPFDDLETIGTCLYYASYAGLQTVARELLAYGADVNTLKEVNLAMRLQAASWEGYEKVVQMLLERGADVNAQGVDYGNALLAASWRPHKKVVETLYWNQSCQWCFLWHRRRHQFSWETLRITGR
jgi:hypothetical protein